MQSEIHVIGNLYEAAYVVATTGQLPAVILEPSGRARFDFQDADGSVSWLAQAWSLEKGLDDAELTVPVKQFCNALNKLKNAMGVARKQASIYEDGKKAFNRTSHSQSRNTVRQANNHRI